MSFGLDRTDKIRLSHRRNAIRAGNAATLAGIARARAVYRDFPVPEWVASVDGRETYTKAEETRLVGELLRLLDAMEPEQCPF